MESNPEANHEVYSFFYESSISLSNIDYVLNELKSKGSKYEKLLPKNYPAKSFPVLFQAWIDVQLQQLSDFIKLSKIPDQLDHQPIVSPHDQATSASSPVPESIVHQISVKKKRVNPSQLTEALEAPSLSTAFINNEDNKDIRKELLEKKSSAFVKENMKSMSIRETYENSEALLHSRKVEPLSITNLSFQLPSPRISPTKSSSNYSLSQFEEGMKRISSIYSLLVLKQAISFQEFFAVILKLLSINTHKLKNISSAIDEMKESLPLNYFLSEDLLKSFLSRLIELSAPLFRSLGSVILKNLMKFPVMTEMSPRITSLMNEWIENAENEFPTQYKMNMGYQQTTNSSNHGYGGYSSGFNNNSSAPAIKSFMKQYHGNEDNRLEQKTKVSISVSDWEIFLRYFSICLVG
jgi:hypothetical protein